MIKPFRVNELNSSQLKKDLKINKIKMLLPGLRHILASILPGYKLAFDKID